MQQQQSYTVEHGFNPSSIQRNMNSTSIQEPQQNHKKLARAMTLLLIIALLLVIALAISVTVLFTIGLQATQSSKNSNTTFSTPNNLFRSSLSEPCTCGCPSIEPTFNDEKKVIAARIINGQTARAHSWPWQLFLVVQDSSTDLWHTCGATMLTQRHFLTAAHCVHGGLPPNIFLLSGRHVRMINTSMADIHIVKNVYIHEGFNIFGHNDLAIVTSEEPLRFDSYVSPICLDSPNSPLLQPDEELVVIGWGAIHGEPENLRFPDSLQQVKVAYVPTSNPNCSKIFGSNVALHPGQMCAGIPGHNACRGDSGGPLMRRKRLVNTETNYYWEQVGVASLSKDCGWNSTWPDIYTSVSYYHDWIVATVKRAI
ncbi:unnamed protein product [Rotaria socialis]|uniref:Peptidase S1 domain-containing protein n=1 Tax=Rotaria socialis TaxID=392032 RepID=A0A818K220_9BILA|nr:unnamed protein product [Rotaria socialis]CAF4461168.1 unnamed protein product [Rotaria socialis]